MGISIFIPPKPGEVDFNKAKSALVDMILWRDYGAHTYCEISHELD